MKKIDVIITTYNRPIKVLKRAVNSVKQQSYKNYEVYVVNDAPENTSGANLIIQLIQDMEDERFHYISYDHNKGACAARNIGVRNGSSELLAFLDDDDEWFPQKLEESIKLFNTPQIGLVYSPYCEYDKNYNGTIFNKSGIPQSPIERLLYQNYIGGCSMVMLRRDSFESVGGFDESLLASQDLDLWLKIIEKYDLGYVDIPLVKRYLQDDSISANFNKKKQGWEKFLINHHEIYMQNPKAYNYKLNSMASQSIWFGEIKYAFNCWKRALLINPFLIKNNLRPIRSFFSFLVHESSKK